MKLLFQLLGHSLVTLALKHQLLIMKAFAAAGPQFDLVGSADAWVLYAFGVTEALA